MRTFYFPTDQSLVQKTRRGDQESFSRLVERHGPRVFHLLRRLTNNSEMAEDLTQETFVAAYTAIDSWRGEGAFPTWLCGIAVRRYRLMQRWSAQQPNSESLDCENSPEVSIPNDDPLAHLKRHEAEAALSTAIAELSESCREVFVLVRVEELPYQAVANLLDIPLGTVQSRLNRATRFLHQRLSPFIYGTDDVAAMRSARVKRHDLQ